MHKIKRRTTIENNEHIELNIDVCGPEPFFGQVHVHKRGLEGVLHLGETQGIQSHPQN